MRTSVLSFLLHLGLHEWAQDVLILPGWAGPFVLQLVVPPVCLRLGPGRRAWLTRWQTCGALPTLRLRDAFCSLELSLPWIPPVCPEQAGEELPSWICQRCPTSVCSRVWPLTHSSSVRNRHISWIMPNFVISLLVWSLCHEPMQGKEWLTFLRVEKLSRNVPCPQLSHCALSADASFPVNQTLWKPDVTVKAANMW